MTKRVDIDQLCHDMAVEVAQWHPKSIEELACKVFVDHVRYVGDGFFEIGNLDEMRLKPVETK